MTMMTDLQALTWLADRAAAQAEDALAQVGVKITSSELTKLGATIFTMLLQKGKVPPESLALVRRQEESS